jgi:pimeloyl-ACP methyl ester carboxylesterase
MGHEYIASHRAYRQLAVRLADIGFPVLRFDFYGCGDSRGNCKQGQIRQWLTDVEVAIAELRRRCRLEKICLGGLRLGASLSMVSAAERLDIDGIVLWDPVVSGEHYVEELARLQQDIVERFSTPLFPCSLDGKATESLGFPLTEALLSDLKKLDLMTVQRKPANSVLSIVSHDDISGRRLKEHLQSTKARVEYQILPGPKLWLEDINKILVPNQILNAIVSWMSRMYP